MKAILSVIFAMFLSLLISCSESSNSETGTISVYIIDNDPDETPVPNIIITLIPDSLIKETNENGFCSFEVDPGDYFINADLCCIGPGFIHYNEPVTILQGENKEIKLIACLRCL